MCQALVEHRRGAYLPVPCTSSGVERIDLLRFLSECRKR